MNDVSTLRVSGLDLIISASVLDVTGAPVVSGQTVKFNIQRKSDDWWWNGSAWADIAEPSILSASQVTGTNIWEYTLTEGYTSGEDNYTIHYLAEGAVNEESYGNYLLYEISSFDDASEFVTSANSNIERILKELIYIKSEIRYQKKHENDRNLARVNQRLQREVSERASMREDG